MNKQRKINLNLASRPLRNRRLFWFLTILMSGLIIIMTSLSSFYFFTSLGRSRTLRSSLSHIEAKISQVQREKEKYAKLVQDISSKNKKRVEQVNDVIFEKSFSWNEFLSRLEEALPERSYISYISLSPLESSRMEVKIRVVSSSLEDLLELIRNLKALNFQNIRPSSEKWDGRGQLVSEVSLTYERMD